MSSRPKLRTAKLKNKHCVKDAASGLRIAEHAYEAQQYGVSHPNTKVTKDYSILGSELGYPS